MSDVDPLATMAWEAALPVHCTLAEGCREDRQQGADTDCYFMVPRQGYLGYSLKVVLRTFAHLQVLGEGRTCYLWFSFMPPGRREGEQLIVPWHYPMGVVVDRLAAACGARSVTELFAHALQLTVTFSETPPAGDENIPATVANVEKVIEIWLKQAHKATLFSRFLSIKAWVRFEPKDYNNFLAAPRTNDVGAFFVGKAGLEAQCRRDLSDAEYKRGEKLAYVVLHVAGQNAVPLTVDSSSLSSLGLLLRDALPCCYDLSDDDVQSLDPLPMSIADVFVLGTRPPLLTPTSFLRDHLCCADLAVHIVGRP